MSKASFCPLCNRAIVPEKKFSWGWFLLLCVTGIGGIFYLIHYFIFKKKQCPICGNKRLMKAAPEEIDIKKISEEN